MKCSRGMSGVMKIRCVTERGVKARRRENTRRHEDTRRREATWRHQMRRQNAASERGVRTRRQNAASRRHVASPDVVPKRRRQGATWQLARLGNGAVCPHRTWRQNLASIAREASRHHMRRWR